MSAPQKRPHGGCDALSQHMHAIFRIPLLTAEEEISLARLVQAGRQVREVAEEMKLRAGGVAPSLGAWALEAGLSQGQLRRCLRQASQARSRMVMANLRLVVSMARRSAHRPADLEDLIQEGTIGLIRAVERFDPSRGYRFSTYAVWWIRDGIGRALATRSRTIRLPSTMVQKLQRLRQTQHALMQELGRDPSLDELALATGLKPLDIREVLFRAQEPLSLDSHQGGETDLRLLDTLACQSSRPQEQVMASLMRQDIEELLNELPPREAELLRLRYGLQSSEEPLSLSAAARQMGITRDTARGLERRANASMRRLSTRIGDYLEA
ncbi:MAG: sigma-70 family RNA polymerase sigma factor [Synechococcaceae cyanobacterium]